MTDSSHQIQQKTYKMVVIGASAGGIDAIIPVLTGLAPRLAAPIVIVQHLRDLEDETKLPEVISRRSGFPVELASNGKIPQMGRAYLAEPGKHLLLKDNRMIFDMGKPVRFVRPSVDVLFASAAKEYGKRVIAVILSGIGSDGAAGCREIKKHGGVCIAQEKNSSMFHDMPEAAVRTGAVDFVLPVDQIAVKVEQLVQNTE